MTMPTMTDRNYTDEELREMLSRMKDASTEFYRRATAIGNHAFIEFTGLMNEYIKACEEALAAGQDFTLANTHTGIALPLQPHHVMYLAEKLNCIYGPTLASNDKLAYPFVATLFGAAS